MSAEMGSSTEVIEVFIPLRNEGTDVLRPTRGLVLGSNEVEVLPTPDYDPADEEWEYPPGTRVRCTRERKDGREVLVARQRAS
ncbi:MAG TPA: hypothetical protein VG406_29635 [Isosphaeraceae bacterium]|jgi:hypothetical protein|nr:hypothetical protein [Isosphaeraceae bacterium]